MDRLSLLKDYLDSGDGLQILTDLDNLAAPKNRLEQIQAHWQVFTEGPGQVELCDYASTNLELGA
jgi:hypothetical protein